MSAVWNDSPYNWTNRFYFTLIMWISQTLKFFKFCRHHRTKLLKNYAQFTNVSHFSLFINTVLSKYIVLCQLNKVNQETAQLSTLILNCIDTHTCDFQQSVSEERGLAFHTKHFTPSLKNSHLLSFWVIDPFSSFDAISASTLLASFAKSKSRTSWGDTGTMAKASLSSLIAAQPT